MFKNKLQYMLNDNPDMTITEKGVKVRNKIRPFFFRILQIGNKLTLIIEKRSSITTARPIIYVASHGFKDDVLNTVLTIRDNAYVVFGNIDLFYNTFDGFCLWIYGSQLVDRYDKNSKKAMKEKMKKLIQMGNNIIIFSEATWNLSPNNPMEKLHWGFYDVLMETNALVVPVLTHKVGKNCYSRVLEPLDLKVLSKEDVECIYLNMRKYAEKAIDLCIYDNNYFNSLKNYLIIVLEKIVSINYTVSLENSISIISIIEKSALELWNRLMVSIPSFEDNFMESSYELIKKLVLRISCSTKEVMVNNVRNIMALEKVDMYDKHPDYSYMSDGKDIYEAWDDYLQDTIKSTPYFYPEDEKTTIFVDPLIANIDDVMPWINKERQVLKKKR